MSQINLRIAMAQLDFTVGDLQGNLAKIKQYIGKAEAAGADIVAFPELAITGYPPEDLLLKPKFVADNLACLQRLAKSVKNIAAIVGFADKKGDRLYNAAAVISGGKIIGVYHKMLLPNYAVFDEKRYFQAGDRPLVFRLGETVFGVNICEDIWHQRGPTELQAKAGAKLVININASPYYAGKIREREKIVQAQAKANRIHLAYVNLIGGQDELVFDGQSMIVDSKGQIIGRAAGFKEELAIFDLSRKNKIHLPQKEEGRLGPEAEIYQALMLGLKDYLTKNGFQKAVIGLSGGIDSAFVAALASDALGRDNTVGVFMPSRYSSRESAEDAQKLAENLGIRFLHISIEQIYKIFLLVLEPLFSGLEKNIAEENLQARIRGNALMALSNKFGWLVLTTGNKSEMSTGYATLYGDMAGGFAVIKDVPKTMVYRLARYRNSMQPVIPARVLSKAPTAELRPRQKDSDTLPVYEKLDPILKAYVEQDWDLEKIVSSGLDRETAARVLAMVDKSEYKRRQSPPGIKITPKAFGKDRRMPITNKYPNVVRGG